MLSSVSSEVKSSAAASLVTVQLTSSDELTPALLTRQVAEKLEIPLPRITNYSADGQVYMSQLYIPSRISASLDLSLMIEKDLDYKARPLIIRIKQAQDGSELNMVVPAAMKHHEVINDILQPLMNAPSRVRNALFHVQAECIRRKVKSKWYLLKDLAIYDGKTQLEYHVVDDVYLATTQFTDVPVYLNSMDEAITFASRQIDFDFNRLPPYRTECYAREEDTAHIAKARETVEDEEERAMAYKKGFKRCLFPDAVLKEEEEEPEKAVKIPRDSA